MDDMCSQLSGAEILGSLSSSPALGWELGRETDPQVLPGASKSESLLGQHPREVELGS